VDWARAKLSRNSHALFTSVNNLGCLPGDLNNATCFKCLAGLVASL